MYLLFPLPEHISNLLFKGKPYQSFMFSHKRHFIKEVFAKFHSMSKFEDHYCCFSWAQIPLPCHDLCSCWYSPLNCVLHDGRDSVYHLWCPISKASFNVWYIIGSQKLFVESELYNSVNYMKLTHYVTSTYVKNCIMFNWSRIYQSPRNVLMAPSQS